MANFGTAWITVLVDKTKVSGEIAKAQAAITKAVLGSEMAILNSQKKTDAATLKSRTSLNNQQVKEQQKLQKSLETSWKKISSFATKSATESARTQEKASAAIMASNAKVKKTYDSITKSMRQAQVINANFAKRGATSYDKLTASMRGAQVINDGFTKGLRNAKGEVISTSKSFSELTMGIFKSAPAFAVATAGISAVHSAIRLLRDELIGGFVAMEEFTLNVISMSAFITSFSQRAAEGDIGGAYQEAGVYAEQLVKKLEVIDALTIANAQDLRVITESFIKQGVLLDVNNEKQIAGFINITNALKLMTKGQNQQIQLRQEIRALVQGELRDSNVLVKTLAAIDPQIKSHLKTWRAQGVTIEKVGELLKGFGPAAADFQKTFAAAGTTMQTIHDKILRGAFGPTYEWLLEKVIMINKSLLDSSGNLTKLGKSIQDTLSKNLKGAVTQIERVAAVTEFLYNLYKKLPEGSTMGIIGLILIGKGNLLVGSLIVVNEAMGRVGNSLGDLIGKGVDVKNSFIDTWTAISEGKGAKEFGNQIDDYNRSMDLLLVNIKAFSNNKPQLVGLKPPEFGPKTQAQELGIYEGVGVAVKNMKELGLLEQRIFEYQLSTESNIQKKWLDDQKQRKQILDKSQKDREDRLQKRKENQKKTLENLAKQRKEYAKLTDKTAQDSLNKRKAAEDKYYKILGLSDKRAYKFKKGLILQETGDMVAALGNTKAAVDKGTEYQLKKIKELDKARKDSIKEQREVEIERLRDTGNFVDAIKAANMEIVDSSTSTAKKIGDGYKRIYAKVTEGIGDFINPLKESFLDVESLWESMLDSMLSIFADTMVKIAAEAATEKLVSAAGGLFDMGVSFLSGLEIFHDGTLKADEGLAILQNGEMVIPAEQSQVIRDSLSGSFNSPSQAYDAMANGVSGMKSGIGSDALERFGLSLAGRTAGVAIAGSQLGASPSKIIGAALDPKAVMTLGIKSFSDAVLSKIGAKGITSTDPSKGDTITEVLGAIGAYLAGPLGYFVGKIVGGQTADYTNTRDWEREKDAIEQSYMTGQVGIWNSFKGFINGKVAQASFGRQMNKYTGGDYGSGTSGGGMFSGGGSNLGASLSGGTSATEGPSGDPAGSMKAKYGGVFSGPMSGFPMEMHGTEAVVPLPNGKSIPVEMSGSGNDKPLNITIMIGNEQFDSRIEKIADDVRVEATRRDLGIDPLRP